MHARAAVFALVAVYVALGPFYRQVLGGRSPLVRPWVMYQSYGTTACDVRFWQRTPDGDVRVDRYEVLGKVWHELPVEERRLTTRAQVTHMARQLCDALGPGTDLRIDARCGSDDGWQVFAARETDLCR